jgi:hypothetical protein
MRKRRFETAFIASLIICIAVLSIAVAELLFTLNKNASWSVSVSAGLLLTDISNTEIDTLNFTVSRYGTQTKTLRIHNIGNGKVNVTQSMPISTVYYTFSTTYTPSIINIGQFIEFNITLTDLSMSSDVVYSGLFSWTAFSL